MIIKNNVLDFIKQFQTKETIRVFVENNFWFAYILYGRFAHGYDAKIVYDDTDEDNYYFGTKIGDNVYDITGIITNQADWKYWDNQ